MPSLAVTTSGVITRLNADGTFVTLTTPINSTVSGGKPAFFQYQGSIYIVGTWTRGIMLDSYSRLPYTMGINAPTVAPTIAAGIAGAISSNSTVAYYSYIHKIGEVTVDESALSPVSNELTGLASKKIDWTALPSAVPSSDTKVTHVRLYRSDDGADPRVVADVAIGTTTYTDNIATLALGAAAELVDIGAPPENLIYSGVYAERAWYVSSDFPNRIYYSGIGKPQSVGSDSYLVTRDGEAVTGLKKLRDQLMIGCRNCFYSAQLIQGSTNAFVIEKVEPSVGLLSHWGIVNIHNRLWFPSQDGVFIYDGSFRLVSAEIWHLWRQEYYATSEAFHQMEAEHDSYRKIYKLKYLKATTSSIQSRYFCASYSDFEPTIAGGQGQPTWSMDFRGRRDTAMGLLSWGNGAVQLYTGSTDGVVRAENDETDTDDDGDSYVKALTLQTGIDWAQALDTDPEGGRTVTDLRLYVESETSAWQAQVLGGDERVVDAYAAAAETDNLIGWWKKSVAASYKTYTSGVYSYVASAQTHHHFIPEKVSGRGVNLFVTVNSPVGFHFHGWGATTLPGPTSRPWVSKTALPVLGPIATPGDSEISLTWTALAGAETYTVKRALVTGGPYANVITGLTTNSYLDTGLSNGTDYYYVISGTAFGVEGADSAEVTANPSP